MIENKNTAAQWKRTEICLRSAKTYENPFLDVEIDAVFTHESGFSIALPGFWKGGDQWCVRFAPTRPGRWAYTVTCSDGQNTGLQQKGVLDAQPAEGGTLLDQKGWVRLEENARYFVYDDGTPFFWLGDTHWQMPDYERMDACNFPGCKCGNQFMHLLQDRLEKGFNVYQTYPDSAEKDGGDNPRTYHWWQEKYTRIDPAGFNENFDVKMNSLADAGMTIALGLGVHTITPTAMGEEAFLHFTRYMVARYAAYPVVWITGQEITMDMQRGAQTYNIYKKAAALVSKLDGYRHPLGTHLCPQTYEVHRELDAQPWHQWWALQAGHGDMGLLKPQSFYQSYWKSPTKKPFLETEAQYEDLGFGRNGYTCARAAGWKAVQCGSYGFTYGGVGVWALRWSDRIEDGGWSTSYNSESWYMGLVKPGSAEMGFMRAFYEKLPFQRLIPRFFSQTYGVFDDAERSVLATDGSQTYVVYFYNPSTLTGTLKKLYKRKKYAAWWFDPRTGGYIAIAKDFTAKDGNFVLPPKPTPQDWVLLVTTQEVDASPAVAAPPLWLYPPVTAPVHPALEIQAVSCVSDAEGHPASNVLDKNTEAFWRAYAFSGSSTLLFSLEKETKLTYARLAFPPEASLPQHYRIDGSADGKQWQILCDRTMAPLPAQKGEDGLLHTAEELSGTCKFVRLLIFGSQRHQDEKIPVALTAFELFGE